MSRYIVLPLALFWVIASSAGPAVDRFEDLKESLSRAGCARFRFLSVIESDVFDRSDTVAGDAAISSDGRYRVNIGPDQYLYDLTHLYSYSRENAQVTVELIDAEEGFGDEVSFITRLDEFYETCRIVPDLRYRLIKRSSRQQGIPDSMIVNMCSDTLMFDWIEYYDVNEELNRILFLHQETAATCQDSLFIPEYPDSVERIRLD